MQTARIVAVLVTVYTAGVAPSFAQQVFRCPGPGGQTVFQQAPCSGGVKVEVKPANVVEPVRVPASVAPTESAPTPAPAAIAPAKPELERMAEVCLDWYRPRLRDPRGAYQRDASIGHNVLTLTIYGTNGRGGYVSKVAKCEFRSGELDERWTKIQATRDGW